MQMNEPPAAIWMEESQEQSANQHKTGAAPLATLCRARGWVGGGGGGVPMSHIRGWRDNEHATRQADTWFSQRSNWIVDASYSMCLSPSATPGLPAAHTPWTHSHSMAYYCGLGNLVSVPERNLCKIIPMQIQVWKLKKNNCKYNKPCFWKLLK